MRILIKVLCDWRGILIESNGNAIIRKGIPHVLRTSAILCPVLTCGFAICAAYVSLQRGILPEACELWRNSSSAYATNPFNDITQAHAEQGEWVVNFNRPTHLPPWNKPHTLCRKQS